MAEADITKAATRRISAVAMQARPEFPALFLLACVILIQFFAIPVIPGIGLAPENFVFLVVVLIYGTRLARLAFGGGRVSTVVLLLATFGVLAWIAGFLRGEPLGNPGRHFRAAIYMLMLVEVCSHAARRQQIMKLLVLVGVVQVIFGSLVYFVGEPFASIRDWMLSSAQSGETVIGKGSQIASTYGDPHLFAYLLTGLPFVAIHLFLREKKLHWLLALLALLLGLFLNAERSAAAAFLAGMVYLLFRSPQRARNLTVLAILCVAFLAMKQIIGSRTPSGTSGMESTVAYSHGTLSDRFGGTNLAEIADRIMYQVHGIESVLKHPIAGPTQRQYAREVVGGDAIVSSAVTAAVLAPHNHYIDAGVAAGVVGWLMMAWCLWALWKAQRTVRAAVRARLPELRVEALCISVGLAAVMGNAVFHNAGIFSPEIATTSIAGLLLAQYRQVLREPLRRLPATDSDSEAGDASKCAS